MTDELKHINQLIDDMRDNRVIEAAIRAHVQKAIDDEKQNPWKAVIIQELIVDCIFAKEHETDPRKALAAAIDWNCKVALDPSVSKEAQDLQQQAIDAALEVIEDALNAEGRYDSADFVCLHKGSNPLAERDARIAELERERDRAIQQHERCAEKLFNAERELAEARKDAERYRWVRKHAYAVLSADGVDLHTGYQRKLHGTKSPKLWEEDNELDEAIDAAMRQEGE